MSWLHTRKAGDTWISVLASAGDVLAFIEQRGIALRGTVLDRKCRAELLEQAALLPGQLRRRHHVNIHVQIAFSSAMRIGQSFPFQSNDFARLCAFGNFDRLFSV